MSCTAISWQTQIVPWLQNPHPYDGKERRGSTTTLGFDERSPKWPNVDCGLYESSENWGSAVSMALGLDTYDVGEGRCEGDKEDA